LDLGLSSGDGKKLLERRQRENVRERRGFLKPDIDIMDCFYFFVILKDDNRYGMGRVL
jgi:hypothetical protein